MSKRILIVDDDEMVRIALVELLRPEGYEVETVGSARDALAKIEKGMYDLLMLDIIMPEMDGITLCRKIREREDYNEVPIVFLTAKSRDEDREKGMDVGANIFLSKPISPEKLIEVIRETLE